MAAPTIAPTFAELYCVGVRITFTNKKGRLLDEHSKGCNVLFSMGLSEQPNGQAFVWSKPQRFRKFQSLLKKMKHDEHVGLTESSKYFPETGGIFGDRTNPDPESRQARAQQLRLWINELFATATFPRPVLGETLLDRSLALRRFLDLKRGLEMVEDVQHQQVDQAGIQDPERGLFQRNLDIILLRFQNQELRGNLARVEAQLQRLQPRGRTPVRFAP